MTHPLHFRPHLETPKNDRPNPVGLLALSLLVSLLVSACRAPAACRNETGCIVIPPDAPLVLGALHAWLGEHAFAGEQMLAGIQKAIEARKYLLEHEIVLHRAGSECTGESARLAATALLTDPNLFLLLGPTCTDEIEAITPLLADAGVFLVTPPPGEEAAYRQTMQILDILQQVTIPARDGTLYLPRMDLRRKLQALP